MTDINLYAIFVNWFLDNGYLARWGRCWFDYYMCEILVQCMDCSPTRDGKWAMIFVGPNDVMIDADTIPAADPFLFEKLKIYLSERSCPEAKQWN